MSKLYFVIVFVLYSDWMLDMIEALLDNHLGYCFFAVVLQAQVVPPSVQDRTDRSLVQGFFVGIVVPPGDLR